MGAAALAAAPMVMGMMGGGGGGEKEKSPDQIAQEQEAQKQAMIEQERERNKADRMVALSQLAGSPIPSESSQFTKPISMGPIGQQPDAFSGLRNRLR